MIIHWTLYLTAVYACFALSMVIYRLKLINELRERDPLLRKYRAYVSQEGAYIAIMRTRVGYTATILLIVAGYSLYLGYTDTAKWGMPRVAFDIAGVLLITVSFLKMRIWPWSPAEVRIHVATFAPMVNSALGTHLVNFWKMPDPPHIWRWVIIFINPYAPSGYTKKLRIYRWELGSKEFHTLKTFLIDVTINRQYTPTEPKWKIWPEGVKILDKEPSRPHRVIETIRLEDLNVALGKDIGPEKLVYAIGAVADKAKADAVLLSADKGIVTLIKYLD